MGLLAWNRNGPHQSWLDSRPPSCPPSDWARAWRWSWEEGRARLNKHMFFAARMPKAAPIPLSASMRTSNGISLILVFRFLEGSNEIWKEEPPWLATIDLLWFRLAGLYIKTKNKGTLKGWPELITVEPVPPCRTGEGLRSSWAAAWDQGTGSHADRGRGKLKANP